MTKNSKSKISANNRYVESNYERFTFRVKKGEKDEIKAYANASGQSVNSWMYEAIREKMQRQDAEYAEEVEHIPFTD